MQMGWVPVGYANGSQPGGRAQVGSRSRFVCSCVANWCQTSNADIWTPDSRVGISSATWEELNTKRSLYHCAELLSVTSAEWAAFQLRIRRSRVRMSVRRPDFVTETFHGCPVISDWRTRHVARMQKGRDTLRREGPSVDGSVTSLQTTRIPPSTMQTP
jgi:hypothetical protein